MVKWSFVVMAAAVLLAVPAAGKKPLDASIAVESQTATRVNFDVQVLRKQANVYSLWVANVCRDADGVTVSAEYHGVVADADFATDRTNPNAGPVVACSAYVWEFPASHDPVSNTVTFPV